MDDKQLWRAYQLGFRKVRGKPTTITDGLRSVALAQIEECKQPLALEEMAICDYLEEGK